MRRPHRWGLRRPRPLLREGIESMAGVLVGPLEAGELTDVLSLFDEN
ncbi:hypothetical protein [Kitasatospora terrestris]